MRILQLVDSIPYVRDNCFQHQLAIALDQQCELVQVDLQALLSLSPLPTHDGVISCLKQRTLMKYAIEAGVALHGEPCVVYDQDPWQAYMDNSPYKGAYELISKHVNVAAFAMTTKWWVDFVASKGHSTLFAKMWVLPKYCSFTMPYDQRRGNVGFVGSVHPRRQALLDVIEKGGIKTTVQRTNSLGYKAFLDELGKLRTFVHNEDMVYTIDGGREVNFNTGMWVKDVEAASQGCFSIRNSGEGSETYLEGLETVFLYRDMSDVVGVLKHIEAMDPVARQNMIDVTAKRIHDNDVWASTAKTLIDAATCK